MLCWCYKCWNIAEHMGRNCQQQQVMFSFKCVLMLISIGCVGGFFTYNRKSVCIAAVLLIFQQGFKGNLKSHCVSFSPCVCVWVGVNMFTSVLICGSKCLWLYRRTPSMCVFLGAYPFVSRHCFSASPSLSLRINEVCLSVYTLHTTVSDCPNQGAGVFSLQSSCGMLRRSGHCGTVYL